MMVDDGRARGDGMLNDFDKRLAVMEATRALEGQAHEARYRALDKAIEATSSKLDRILDGQNDPGSTPAGRIMQARIESHDRRLTDHDRAIDGFDAFRDEFRGGFKTLRGFVAVLTAISVGLSILAFVR